ncbi:OmpA family protein [Pseudopelagicola sp. nBUS_20]|uniref:OmpA family protein n=1 Tax=Pseudopelagicola sp. nBUS_20 TaxID=3395317 RepID=UPI003EC0B86E
MRLSSLLIVFATFVVAALLSLVTASFSADLIEDNAERGVKKDLEQRGMDWIEVHAEGLQVFLAGIAPSEADRFKAISAAGGVIDAARVIDNMQVEATADIAPPRFSVEILRNDAGISLIGLVPQTSDQNAIVDQMIDIAGRPNVTDLLETAEYDAPDGWSSALKYALNALDILPRAKVSVQAGTVSITAMADDPDARYDLEGTLRRQVPKELRLELNILTPRPVITPFTLRFLIDENGTRFDACSADTEKARVRILTAARAVGLTESANCTIGLGVPTPKWALAAETAMAGLAELGGGSITFSDADVTLVALAGTNQTLFDRVIGELETGLPEVFALHSTLPIARTEDESESTTPEFIATLSPEGLVQLRGRLPNELLRQTTASYARARFGADAVHMAARLDENLPSNWPIRVMAGLDALSQLHNGVLDITPDTLSIAGRTGSPDANAKIARLLSEKLSQNDPYTIEVRYVEELDPVAAMPTAEECVSGLHSIQEKQKITFEPGSGTLDESASDILDAIAQQLKECPKIELEIQGHTDSQGRESMNQALSQTRAQSVLSALQDRRVLTSGIQAKGYGESQPISDNDTEEGRESNRRIKFVLIQSKALSNLNANTSDENGEPSVLNVLEEDSTAQSPVDEATADPDTSSDNAVREVAEPEGTSSEEPVQSKPTVTRNNTDTDSSNVQPNTADAQSSNDDTDTADEENATNDTN